MILETVAVALEYLEAALVAVEAAQEIFDAFQALRDAVEAEPPIDTLSDDERLTLLKKLTGQIVRLNSNLNIYPVGYNTTLVFDVDGNLLP